MVECIFGAILCEKYPRGMVGGKSQESDRDVFVQRVSQHGRLLVSGEWMVVVRSLIE